MYVYVYLVYLHLEFGANEWAYRTQPNFRWRAVTRRHNENAKNK